MSSKDFDLGAAGASRSQRRAYMDVPTAKAKWGLEDHLEPC
jgi:hypothetical protein